jgi:hypothetical protein
MLKSLLSCLLILSCLSILPGCGSSGPTAPEQSEIDSYLKDNPEAAEEEAAEVE